MVAKKKTAGKKPVATQRKKKTAGKKTSTKKAVAKKTTAKKAPAKKAEPTTLQDSEHDLTTPLWQRPPPFETKKHGRPHAIDDPVEFYNLCVGYFRWLEANPLKEAKLVSYQGESVLEKVPKMRAATIPGLCLYVGIDYITFRRYEEREGFSGICAWARECIREQKFTGAASDLLNHAIIARDLGLKEQTTTEHDATEQFAELLKALGDRLPD